MADWLKIKTEYITEGSSHRKLAKKYGLNITNIANRGRSEGWVEERNQKANETQRKIEAAIEKKRIQRAERLQAVTDKLLNKVEMVLDGPGELPAGSLRNLAATLRDIKDLQMIRSPLDEQEQKAKIAVLERQVDKSAEEGGVTVVLEGGTEDFAQ